MASDQPHFVPYRGVSVPGCLIVKGRLHPTDQARDLLARYYQPFSDGGCFEGSLWDVFDPSGTRAVSANVFTADDVWSLRLPSINPPMHAVTRLLVFPEDAQKANRLLEDLPADEELVDQDSVEEFQARAQPLWRYLRSLTDVGHTTASKLMARKRPALLPVFDSVIKKHVVNNSDYLWEPLWDALRAEDRALHRSLVELRKGSGLPAQVSALRVFDVLCWMQAVGQYKAP